MIMELIKRLSTGETMNDSTALIETGNDQRTALIAKMVSGLDSPHTRRAYQNHISEFEAYLQTTGATVSKETVNGFKAHLRETGKGHAAINQRLSAIRFFIREAADAGLMSQADAEIACKAKGVKQAGQRLGNWLTTEQAEAIINSPDTGTAMGLRDRAALALLIGAGLRRHEAVRLTVQDIQQREGRWVIVDMIGKGGKTRSIPLAPWFKRLIDDWCNAAGITEGVILRQCSWAKGKFEVKEAGLSEQGIYRIAQRYGAPIGVSTLAPHDMRRTFAKLSRKGGAGLEQIQMSLGHASLDTTKRYLGDEQDLQNAPSDFVRLNVRA